MPVPRPSLPIAIQRYFDVSLYLLVLTGVGTLASTGTLTTPTILFVGSALVFRGYLLAEKRTLMIPERWTSFLTIGYVIFYLVDYFLISRGFLDSTVHLVLFAMVVRLFSAPRNRDQYLLMVISFLLVLAAAVLTVDSVFLMTFTAFIFMAIVTCILMEMKQTASKATFQAANPLDGMAHRHMAFSVVRVVPLLVVLIIVGGAAIFFLLPRISVGYMGNFAEGSDLTTGFSDHVELGNIGLIQQSNALVMHIAIDGDKVGAFDLKWRGISLNVFDGRTWSDSHKKRVLPPQPGAKYLLHSMHETEMGTSGRLIHYRVLMEPLGSGVFFLTPSAQSLQGPYRLVTLDDGGAVFDEDYNHPITEYEATSSIGGGRRLPPPDAGGSYPDDILADYEPIPKIDPRIPEMARQITAQAGNNFDRAMAIEKYLQTHFGYTLQMARTRPVDPLAEFLFVRKRGHCEYFASSMAIMLRTLGIPSRVVNGFRTGEFNDLTSQYLVRERDAHSWVEAYFPDYGWISFDPTPAGVIAPPTGWNRAALYMDAMASFWRDWVVSYDTAHQSTLGQVATRGSLQWYRHIRRWIVREYRSLLATATTAQANLVGRPLRWALLGLLTGVLLAMLANARKLLILLRRARLSADTAERPRDAAGIWYERMVKSLSRKGWRKQPAQTPAEFVDTIDNVIVKEKIARFTTFYEGARFGGSTEHAGSLPQLYKEIVRSTQRKSKDKKVHPNELPAELPDYAGADK